MCDCVCREPSSHRSPYLVRKGVAFVEPRAMLHRLTRYGAIHARINELLFRVQELEKKGKRK